MFGIVGHMAIWFPWDANGTPANAYITEDATAIYVTEDGLSPYVTED